MLNNYKNFLDFYTNDIQGTGYLAFRDLPQILDDCRGKKTLDFGCGAGRSTKYLSYLGCIVTGIDINADMINMAKNNLKNCQLILTNDSKLPFKDNIFDIVFNSFVLLDISSLKKMKQIFKEMHRVCKNGGKVISIVNSNYLFTKNWLTVKNDYPQNIKLNSGDIARILLTDVNIELFDYYWSNKDYEECLHATKFSNIKKYEPLAKLDENYAWKDELIYPPYSIYSAIK